MSQKVYIRAIAGALVAINLVQPVALAQGFFGGIKLATPSVDGSAEKAGDAVEQPLFGRKPAAQDALALGLRVPAWERTRNLFSTEQTSLYGGVKTQSGLGFGAALSQVRPALGNVPGTVAAQSNPLPLGMLSSTLGPALNPGNVGLDVYSSFDVTNRVSLFGRLGYERNEARPLQGNEALLISPISGSTVKSGQSMNFGLGIRFDVSPSLGVRAEYSRGLKVERPEFSKETEADTLSLGLRWKF
jgi:opacity protein-like surface antigen